MRSGEQNTLRKVNGLLLGVPGQSEWPTSRRPRPSVTRPVQGWCSTAQRGTVVVAGQAKEKGRGKEPAGWVLGRNWAVGVARPQGGKKQGMV
jgi:hypothetical protein